ncbi:MAG: type I restriction endonuclease, partial [Candidatus Eremiobacterota bacterium]
MSIFTELNSVEYFIIHQLTGVNLNNVRHGMVKEGNVPYGGNVKWKYIQPELLQRNITDIFLEKELKESLIRLNPAISDNPERAEEIIRKLRAVLISVGNVGLVRANEEFSRWLRGEITMPLGKNHEHVPVCLIDFEEINNNSFILTNQFK